MENMIHHTSRIPLAERMRPSSLEALIGQRSIVGKNGIISRALAAQHLPSMILWGPPGVGKTTLAHILANTLKMPIYTLSATTAGVKEVRRVIDIANRQGRCILFIDEIHRFNKAQQDALLAAVEKGIIILIGATTENPSFEVNPALVSRCQVYTLSPLTDNDMLQLIDTALKKDPVLSQKKIVLKESEALLKIAGGDARKLLNALELLIESCSGDVQITNDKVVNTVQKRISLYDKKGEQHYNIISAFIKSIRGSDPNAAVYYLARMIEGGEDVKFIARRMVILAAEDIGNANPNALVLATSAFQAVALIGYPEAQLILSQCATYLAASPKSNASCTAILQARKAVAETRDLPVPLAIRNAPTHMMKDMHYGKGYRYAHDHQGNFVDMEFLPEPISGTVFYNPGNNPREQEMKKRLKNWWGKKYNY